MHRRSLATGLLCAIVSTACSVQQAAAIAGGVFTFGILAAIKGHEIKDVYYLGVVDPIGQLPPTIYRITMRGEASIISSVRFESGWVKAELVDTLGTSIDIEKSGVRITRGEGGSLQLKSGRPMWLLGPEGFRQTPKDERLVVVMGSNPSAFFQTVAKVLGELDTASQIQRDQLTTRRAEILELLEIVSDELIDLPQASKEN